LYFTKDLFTFLKDLKKHNNREWFQKHKDRYEAVVRDPVLKFISDFGPHLDKISPHFVADPRPNGGSMMRIYRDTRFSADKTPYKTEIGIAFRHEDANKVMSVPVYFLGISPERTFVGGGIWHPEPEVLSQVRNAIVNDKAGWQKVRNFRLPVMGDSLSRPPRGYDCNHPFIEDIKRRDFTNVIDFTTEQVCSDGFMRDFTQACKSMCRLMEFVCNATGHSWNK